MLRNIAQGLVIGGLFCMFRKFFFNPVLSYNHVLLTYLLTYLLHGAGYYSKS